jgi:hypothetical protein
MQHAWYKSEDVKTLRALNLEYMVKWLDDNKINLTGSVWWNAGYIYLIIVTE